MSGHSKWHSIKHKKARVDAARGRIFTRLIKELTVSARMGGGDADMNPRLRTAIQAAKSANMPAKNIENAIKKGTGELPGVVYEEVVYEGYGPNGVALYISVMTDNKNRTVAEIRYLLNKNGGNLGESGCVAWIFDLKGLITVNADNLDADELALEAIDAGADDVNTENSCVEVYTSPEALEAVRAVLEAKNITVASAEQSLVPRTTVELDEKSALQTLKMLDKLEEIDEVQQVCSNADFPDAVLEKYQS